MIPFSSIRISQRMFFILLCCLLAFGVNGCAFHTNEPFEILTYEKDRTLKQKNLFVFLRGIGGSYIDFDEYGFVDAVKESDAAFDIVIPDAHFGYYAGRTLIPRLQEDIIEPAKQQGYEEIWLVGVSMGGLGSMLYCREHSDSIDGIYLIAPFLGYKAIINEITSAGQVKDWQPGKIDTDDWQRSFWSWLKEMGESGFPVPVYLAAGADDPYHKSHTLFTELLPNKNQVYFIEGKHDYQTFTALWDRFLTDQLYEK